MLELSTNAHNAMDLEPQARRAHEIVQGFDFGLNSAHSNQVSTQNDQGGATTLNHTLPHLHTSHPPTHTITKQTARTIQNHPDRTKGTPNRFEIHSSKLEQSVCPILICYTFLSQSNLVQTQRLDGRRSSLEGVDVDPRWNVIVINRLPVSAIDNESQSNRLTSSSLDPPARRGDKARRPHKNR
ncbi:hypothetical protein PGT21_036768 [Puccinia graminis f. sp. tritici]|uniref:Uncharacterized protein n=1 Tax=Puccinia graminis f. sp. tritici TaxID=56615 RepID=A0A5B0PNB0_PUCGR|nr:hypothetical protein PGT21_000137 [Puccinia graminis f. sp. tritici]KAA1102202.1 hypothetical protein PGT21_036768 [Puccinia graminis f. sp. tritici]